MAAVSPFNFTAIGGNLAGAPALMVRVVVVWESQGCRGQAAERLGRGIRSPQGCGLPRLASTRSKFSLPGTLVLFNRTHLGSCFCSSPWIQSAALQLGTAVFNYKKAF